MSLPGAQAQLQTSRPWSSVDRVGFPCPFGSYVLLASFARGGMGEVYLAMRGGIAGANRLCVLKKLRRDVTENTEYVNRFLDEARVVVTLNHAGIAHVFDVGCVDNEYYLAMEYVSGVNLRTLMTTLSAKASALPQALSLYVVCELLKALDYAHRHHHPLTGKPLHVVHRDVSPQNVMLSYEGEVKLIDFGLASSDLKIEETEAGLVMGKVAYMSPEQARGDEVDPSCDQFAAAVLAYELITGDRFYGDMNHHAIWQVVGRGGFVPRRWHTLQPDLRGILGKALSARSEQRYASCGELRDALGTYMGSHLSFTSERALREFLKNVLADAREEERQFVSQFAHLTADDVQKLTRESHQAATSLVKAEPQAPMAPPPSPATSTPSMPWPPQTPTTWPPKPLSASVAASAPAAPGQSASMPSPLERAFLTTDPTPAAGMAVDDDLDSAALPRAPKRWVAALAGAGAIALVGAFFVGQALGDDDDAAPSRAAVDAPSSANAAPADPPPAPTPVAEPAAPEPPAVPAVEPAPEIKQASPPQPVPEPTRRKRASAKRASAHRGSHADPKPVPEPDPPRQASPEVTTAPTTAKGSEEAKAEAARRDLGRKLEFLKRCEHKCAERILEEHANRPAVVEVPGFRKMVDRCVSDCR